MARYPFPAAVGRPPVAANPVRLGTGRHFVGIRRAHVDDDHGGDVWMASFARPSGLVMPEVVLERRLVAQVREVGAINHVVAFLKDLHGEQVGDLLLLRRVADVHCDEHGDFADGPEVIAGPHEARSREHAVSAPNTPHSTTTAHALNFFTAVSFCEFPNGSSRLPHGGCSLPLPGECRQGETRRPHWRFRCGRMSNSSRNFFPGPASNELLRAAQAILDHEGHEGHEGKNIRIGEVLSFRRRSSCFCVSFVVKFLGTFSTRERVSA